jgi:hypothetical protein
VNEETEFVEAVLIAVRRAFVAQGSNASEIVVITGTAAERNLFYELNSSEFKFCKWEDRNEDLIACETVKRAKGIEAGHVIFATLDDELRDNEMYVGASRARTDLVIIGPEQFATRFRPNSQGF